ncbi:hypothetical protein N0V93_004721 [Gnomoniopsis smithogilvyi]|uniref:Muconate cycloisomerase 1 n=1 Tax=Gnomoniopsis smithogilvyi TaxID=1191159 RepID=A0A9W8YRJ8_9PEZI|nr:hypothetical protein N0V93_004721 [Gnomoniopsis smithogilvyi]
MNHTNRDKPHPQGSENLITSQKNAFPLIVGTFRSPEIYTLHFHPPSPASSSSSPTTSGELSVAHTTAAAGGHSWLALSPTHTHLYTTVWADPPTIASYTLHPNTTVPTLLNTAPIASLSGYVAVTPSGRHLISVGGPSGEVFALQPDGSIGAHVQTLAFRTPAELDDGKRDGVAHGAFGGLRWGSHSVDLSPDGKSVYVADIGHNCIWAYALDEANEREPLTLRTKHVSPRAHDGPRHCWPHPSGRVLYCVQEHSGMVDAFAVGADGTSLAHLHGHTLLPEGKDCGAYWADEVRTSQMYGENGGGSSSSTPRWLYASTRGLEKGTKGYVAAYELDEEGHIRGPAVAIYETRTSGGLANAVEPAPRKLYERMGLPIEGEGAEEFIALTDSEEGWVVILGWNGKRFREVAAVKLEGATAATAVWV